MGSVTTTPCVALQSPGATGPVGPIAAGDILSERGPARGAIEHTRGRADARPAQAAAAPSTDRLRSPDRRRLFEGVSAVAREVVVQIDGDRATIALNRPDKLNALDLALVASFEEVAAEVAADPDVAIVVVRGHGRSFCAGLDLDMFAAEGMSMDFYRHQERGFRLLETMDKTVIAAVHGHCLGGGVQLAAACDVRVASSNAVIGLPAVEEGLFPGMAPYRLPRLIGRGRAASLILTGRSVTAQEAERMGLIDHVADADDFDAQLARLVDEYARAPRAAAAASKRLMALSDDARFEEALRTSEELLESCLRAPEVARARAAWPQRATRR
jgi:enoyl-CoA hydratase